MQPDMMMWIPRSFALGSPRKGLFYYLHGHGLIPTMWCCSMELPQTCCFMPETTRITVPYEHPTENVLNLRINSCLEQTTSGEKQLTTTLLTLQVWY